MNFTGNDEARWWRLQGGLLRHLSKKRRLGRRGSRQQDFHSNGIEAGWISGSGAMVSIRYFWVKFFYLGWYVWVRRKYFPNFPNLGNSGSKLKKISSVETTFRNSREIWVPFCSHSRYFWVFRQKICDTLGVKFDSRMDPSVKWLNVPPGWRHPVDNFASCETLVVVSTIVIDVSFYQSRISVVSLLTQT